MSNELIHGMAASAAQCALNITLGETMLDANVFLAAVIAMLINLDRFGSMSISWNNSGSNAEKRSPIGHSIGLAIIWIYVGYVILRSLDAYLGIAYDPATFAAIILAYTTHLALDHMDGGIYHLPRSMDIPSWLRPIIPGRDRYWPAWNDRSSKHRNLYTTKPQSSSQ